MPTVERFKKRDFLDLNIEKFRNTESLKFRALNIDDEPIRVCVVTPKKLGNACTRNKLKRRIKECVRIFLKENPAIKSKMVMILPKKRCFEMDFSSLKNEMYKVFF